MKLTSKLSSPLVLNLVGYALRQVIGGAADQVTAFVQERWTDHSQALPKALAQANERTWKALSVALAGEGFCEQMKRLFADGDAQGLREQVARFLNSGRLGFEGTPVQFRRQCLTELNALQQSGRHTVGHLDPAQVAVQTSHFARYDDRRALLVGAQQAVQGVAEALREDYPNLARLLGEASPDHPPLLASAFAYFLRREIEKNAELARGLLWDNVQQLTASHAAAFEELSTISPRLEEMLGWLARLCAMQQEAMDKLDRLGMQRSEVRPHHSFSIRNDDERSAVKLLLSRFRELPPTVQKEFPTLLSGLGRLQIGAGEFGSARETFGEVATLTQGTAQAEAYANTFRAALEERRWDAALAAIQEAATRDRERFMPFPLHRYKPRRILGAGGFGTAFLCHDSHFDEDVVVKTLHVEDLERQLKDVFREAQLLRRLSHPNVIGIRDCEYAHQEKQLRPYLVMDYFPGVSLHEFVEMRGTLSPSDLVVVALQIVSAMEAAHASQILHRDLKPENILVRKEGSLWQVKVIDFGLALRRQVIETSAAVVSAVKTVLGESAGGTLQYAPPEQMGRVPGVKVGFYSDVYAFGKLCCYALFKTTEPKSRHWKSIPAPLADLLEQCTEQDLPHRLKDFDAVRKVLKALDPAEAEESQRLKLTKQMSDNLASWRASTHPQEWVASHKGVWNHAAWLNLLDGLRKSVYWPMSETEVGRVLEDVSRRYRAEQKEVARQERERGEAVRQRIQREESERLKLSKQMSDNLASWRASEHPQKWVAHFKGVWTHADWENLLASLRKSDTWPMNEAEVAAVLEEVARQYKSESAKPKGIRAGDVITDSFGFKLAFVPRGSFWMGENGTNAQRQVEMPYDFYMGVYPVTQGEWQAIMGNNPSHFTSDGGFLK